MCLMCGRVHRGSFVTSKSDLRDFEVLDITDGGNTLYVREVDVWDVTGTHIEGTDDYVPVYDVEVLEAFYLRMH